MSSLAGSFLVAKPSLKDPNFVQSVILLLTHDEDGAFGVVVNRPLAVDGLPFPVMLGGPCESDGVILLHGHEDWNEPSAEASPGGLFATRSPEVAPGIYLGNAQSFKRACEADSEGPVRVRVLRNYSGWGPNQLEGEIATGTWALTAATAEVLFETPVEELWFRLVPSSIPEPSEN